MPATTAAPAPGAKIDPSLDPTFPLDVTLSDGRVLRYQGLFEVAPGSLVCVLREKRGLAVLVGFEPYLDGRYGTLLHVSLSLPNRLPGWKDVKLVKDAFYGPSVAAMIVLPKAADYVNDHPYTHHLWQVPEEWSDAGPVAGVLP